MIEFKPHIKHSLVKTKTGKPSAETNQWHKIAPVKLTKK